MSSLLHRKSRKNLAGLLAACALAAGASACSGIGGNSPSANPAAHSSSGTNGSGAGSGNAHTPLPTFTEAPQSMAGDVPVNLNPVTYAPGSPCAPVSRTTTRTVVPPACQSQWLQVDSVYVPGQNLMKPDANATFGTPMPTTAMVSKDVPPGDGAADATAYFRLIAFSNWALPYTDKTVVATLDTARYSSRDPVIALWNQGGYLAQPPACSYPMSFRVVMTDGATQAFLSEQGWPQASKTAVVATFPACPGVDVTFRHADGTSTTSKSFGQDRTGSAIVAGLIQDISPFGSVWVVNGYAPCGPSQLKAICG